MAIATAATPIASAHIHGLSIRKNSSVGSSASDGDAVGNAVVGASRALTRDVRPANVEDTSGADITFYENVDKFCEWSVTRPYLQFRSPHAASLLTISGRGSCGQNT